jgi:hypothetical protein
MQWFNINKSVDITGKSSRTVRKYLQDYKKLSNSKSEQNNMFKYETDSRNNKILMLSELFLQTYFSATIPPLQNTPEAPEVTPVIDMQGLEQRYHQREQELKQYFNKQIEEIKEAKQQTIDLLKEQLDKSDYTLNKVLEQYSMAQITIQNLTAPQNDSPIQLSQTENSQEMDDEFIQEIIDDNQKSETKLSTTEEYYKEHYPEIDRRNTGLGALMEDENDTK